jgi:transposase
MTRDEAISLLEMDDRERAVEIILALAEKADRYDKEHSDISPTTPSGMVPVYLKPTGRKRKKKPGRKMGHPGVSRKSPQQIDREQEHLLECCPNCGNHFHKPPVNSYSRTIEDIPEEIKPETVKHVVYGYWCGTCRKIVFPTVTDALPNAMIGLRTIVFTAWLHYLVGMSVSNLVKTMSTFCHFQISAGGLTQAWKKLADLLEDLYEELGRQVARGSVLHADETGWRLNGITHWLWCFAGKKLCYYIITKSRGSPVVEKVLGCLFNGILITDFWGAYNRIDALAKQRCFYHLFTELLKVDKRNSSKPWKAFRKKLSRLLRDAIRLSEKRDSMKTTLFERLKTRLHKRLDQLVAEQTKDPDAHRLIKRLKRHRHELLTFLDYPEVSPYNNHAEQQMRKPVLVRKVSQQNRSEDGARTQAILMSLFRSAELQGNNPIETVLKLAKLAMEQKNLAIDFFKLAA